MLEYKGYLGKVEYDDEAEIFHGEVLNTRDVITFQGDSVKSLRSAFEDSIKDYLDFCKAEGKAPDKPFSGQFVTRLTPELHRRINAAAEIAGLSLNAWVVGRLQEAILSVSKDAEPRINKTPKKSTLARKSAQPTVTIKKKAAKKTSQRSNG